MGLEFDYGTSNYARDVLITTKCEQLEQEKATLSQELTEKHL